MIDYARFTTRLARRRSRLGDLSGDEAMVKLEAIQIGQGKEDQINLFVSTQGANLPNTLMAKGVALATWNANWSQVAALAPTIDQITTALNAGDYTWDATKDTAFNGWKTAVDNLYNWVSCIIQPGSTNCGGGTVVPPPVVVPPGGGTITPSSNTLYYVIGGVAAAALVTAVVILVAKK